MFTRNHDASRKALALRKNIQKYARCKKYEAAQLFKALEILFWAPVLINIVDVIIVSYLNAFFFVIFHHHRRFLTKYPSTWRQISGHCLNPASAYRRQAGYPTGPLLSLGQCHIYISLYTSIWLITNACPPWLSCFIVPSLYCNFFY